MSSQRQYNIVESVLPCFGQPMSALRILRTPWSLGEMAYVRYVDAVHASQGHGRKQRVLCPKCNVGIKFQYADCSACTRRFHDKCLRDCNDNYVTHERGSVDHVVCADCKASFPWEGIHLIDGKPAIPL